MVLKPQSDGDQEFTLSSRQKGKSQAAPVIPAHTRLLDLVRSGLSVVTPVWSFSTQDWVTSVSATDIDDDGDIEVIAGSRDGHVYALTKWGSQKWKISLGSGQWVSTVVGISQIEAIIFGPMTPRIIAGSRDGNVYALDAAGAVIANWHYQTGDVVRQIYINPQRPEQVLVGSEDGFIHVLDYETGNFCWKQPVYGAVQSIFSCDVNGDDEVEILVASADKTVYVFGSSGCQKGSFTTEQKVYALMAAPLGDDGKMTILASYRGKDLCGWTAYPQQSKDTALEFKKTWPTVAKHALFGDRIYSIFAAHLNKAESGKGKKEDKSSTYRPPELIVGSEDEHLYILDYQGNLLWKHHLKSCVYNVYALDINLDGIMEVIVGLADKTIQVLRIELIPNLYTEIVKLYKDIGRTRLKSWLSQNDNVSTLLRDLMKEDGRPPYHSMEMDKATYQVAVRSWEAALSLFLKLKYQHVQYYWPHTYSDLGHISTIGLGDFMGDPTDEIVVGNTEGFIFAVDIENNKKPQLWKRKLGERVLMAQSGSTDLNEQYDTILAVLANRRVCAISNEGELQKWLKFPDEEQDRVLCLYINAQGDRSQHAIKEVLFGLENKKIYIYDAQLEQLLDTISTPQGINKIFTHDLTGSGTSEIIVSCLDHHVYVYDRNKNIRWQFQTEDRIRALCAKDIDEDGRDEVIVGSEDRNVYVLDWEGNLKWRYYTPHRVLSVDAYDIDNDDRCEILLGVADGYMYVLNGEGDLLWTFKANERIRAVLAGDLRKDDGVEIVVAAEEHLYLLQMLKQQELKEQIRTCWFKLLDATDFKDHKGATIKLIHHENEYIRAEALVRFASMQLTEEDRRCFQDALKDPSPHVKKELARVIITRFMVDKKDAENIRQLRLLLQQLTSDPDRDVRLAIINILPELTKFDKAICFEHLERFIPNVDLWIRRFVVRKLYHLAVEYPKETFHLLLKTAQDQEPWIRQETGRSLTHYFDFHEQELIVGLHEMLKVDVDLVVFQVIARSAKKPIVKRLFQVFSKLCVLEDGKALEILKEAVDALQAIQDHEILHGEDTYLLYEELYQLYQCQNIDDIVEYRRITVSAHLKQIARFEYIATILDSFEKVVKALQIYRRRDGLGDRAASLIEVTTVIQEIRQEIQIHSAHSGIQSSSKTTFMPEYRVLNILLERWYKVVLVELRRLRGDAILVPQLKAQFYRQDDQVDVSLVITNEGRSPADNVSVTLEASGEYDIIGKSCLSLEEIATVKPSSLNFKINPHTDNPRLQFRIYYDDAEKRKKKREYAEKIELKAYQDEFHDIPNPYNSGTPISNDKMFYGRKEDLEALKVQLSSTAANHVVVLTGQRRSGKTSLIYQFAHNSSLLSPHIPVFIDLQALALKSNVNLLLAGFAGAIYETLKARGINVPRLEAEEFARDPTSIFNNYLEQVTRTLAGPKLVLLIDEFETLEQKIKDQQLDPNFLPYLRHLMQHRSGINFLLAGAPGILHMTAEYWSVFFNIARHHRLSKLKPEDAERLITVPIAQYLEYDTLAVEKIRQLTGDQPYLIHIISETLIRSCNKTHRKYVTINEVNKILDVVLDTGTNHFGWIWNQSSSIERALLSALAQEKGDEERIFSLTDIKETFDEYGFPFEKEKIIAALEHLEQEDFVETRQNSTQFRIPVGLTRAWLRMVKPPEKVVREENIANIM